MLKRITLLFLFIIQVTFSWGQVRVTTGATIESLVQSLQGPGVQISNITSYTPYRMNSSYGSFTDKNNTIGIKSGLILTTGAARFAEGPNNKSNTSQVNNSTTSDPDLENLVGKGVALYDICKVEFDIVTSGNELVFNYVFASEEYNEYTDYNDVFGFFITGPGIAGRKNLAVIPGTSVPVSVSNINLNKNSQFFINNDFPNNRTQYDGFTIPLKASVKVRPCIKYRIKLVIQDTKDANYDSGVFFENGSFSSEAAPPTFSVSYEFPHLNYGIEDCNNAKLNIKRSPGTDINTTLTYPLAISGTAQQGSDFSPIPNQFTIPAGTSEIEIPLTFFQDNIKEDPEIVTIRIPSICPNFPDLASISIPIKDKFDYNIPSTKICQEASVVLNPNPTADHLLNWDTKNILSCYNCLSPIATPDTITYYQYTIQDNISKCQSYDSVKVDLLYLTSDFDYQLIPCYTTQDVFFRNNAKFADHYYWEFSDGSTSKEKNPKHYFSTENISLPHSFTVKLTTTSDIPSCTSTTSKEVEITQGLFLPNLITPNNDFLNDQLIIKGIGEECWTLYVYNKWGGLVYKKENYKDNFQGEDLLDGIYYYTIENSFKDKYFKGWLQIVR